MVDKQRITGLVLAGGRGSRMGGIDKGLQPYGGTPLALHALRRLAPQCGPLLLNANRNLEAYAAFGVPVWPDQPADYAGPLAGLAAGLAQCGTPYLASVPCDSPLFPHDLVERLVDALVAADAEIAIAATREAGEWRPQPVFCLLKTSLRDSLVHFIEGGERQVERWTARQRRVQVEFDDAGAFANANTLAELQQLQPPQAR
ncbi:MAG TPA: molybdenum cofactor guanylyltransferase MobA [Burkholderiaceae bacterium]|jgi:molybdopterin-guanine dinucleotide biosynthesis protein A